MCCVQVLSSKLLEQDTVHRQLSQEQLDNFTLDMNTAYARLKGMEEAIDSKIHTHTHTALSGTKPIGIFRPILYEKVFYFKSNLGPWGRIGPL